jgi:uncharacterized pyridoxal phosphate-containing UPF0001 family protein
VAAGQHAFGENYVQEGCDKAQRLAASGQVLDWHFIGPIQSNKTRQVATWFDWVHSIDREKIAQRLSEQRDAEKGELDVCIQVNVSGEASKSGVTPDQVAALADAVARLPRLKLRGLMAIPEPTDDPRAPATPFCPFTATARRTECRRTCARHTVDGHVAGSRSCHRGRRHHRARGHGAVRGARMRPALTCDGRVLFSRRRTTPAIHLPDVDVGVLNA